MNNILKKKNISISSWTGSRRTTVPGCIQWLLNKNQIIPTALNVAAGIFILSLVFDRALFFCPISKLKISKFHLSYILTEKSLSFFGFFNFFQFFSQKHPDKDRFFLRIVKQKNFVASKNKKRP